MKTDSVHMYDARGFSLVELVVIIAIMGTLLSIATLNFNEWMVKNRVEAQIRQMASDFSQLRVRAFTMKQRHSITVNKESYVFRSYSSESENLSSGGSVVSVGVQNTTVQFPFKKSSGSYYGGEVFEIDSRGMSTSDVGKIFLEYRSGVTPALDCLTIHTLRINPGKKNGSDCDDK